MTQAPAVLLRSSIDVVRSLGRRGIEVTLAVSRDSGAARVSRYTHRTTPAPANGIATEAWLERLAGRQPGAVMFAPSDEPLWWLARHAERAPSNLRSGTPSFAAIQTLLMKGRMTSAAGEVGLAAPRTWIIREADDLQRARCEARYPVILKPQCRVGTDHWLRGRLVCSAEELAPAYEWVRRNLSYRQEILDDAPDMSVPLVQEYRVAPGRHVYHLCGYLTSSGNSVVAAHMKLLQYPPRFGNGACFAAAEVEDSLAEQLLALLRATGYHGMFEAEFAGSAGRRKLIDLNPRSYNGIGLEIARGFDLPWYHYLEATGQEIELSRELERARSLPSRPELVWRDSLPFWSLVAGQVASGGMTPKQGADWARWAWKHRQETIDPFYAPDDPAPKWTHVRDHFRSMVKHPRDFIGSYVLSGLDN